MAKSNANQGGQSASSSAGSSSGASSSGASLKGVSSKGASSRDAAEGRQADVTDAELAVMEVLWTAPATIRGIRDRLYPRGGLAHYTTVQKLLERLEAKGFVSRETGELAHRFTAAVGRDELIGRRLRAMADELCGGSLAPLLTGLVNARPLKQGDIEQLRALIDQLDRKRKPK